MKTLVIKYHKVDTIPGIAELKRLGHTFRFGQPREGYVIYERDGNRFSLRNGDYLLQKEIWKHQDLLMPHQEVKPT